MEKKVEEQFLYDIYGELLTEKQKLILDYYYNDDYNLAEIAELVHVTRQGVYDSVKRSKSTMETYEQKLGLLQRFLRERALLNESIGELAGLLEMPSVVADKTLSAELTKIQGKLMKISENN